MSLFENNNIKVDLFLEILIRNIKFLNSYGKRNETWIFSTNIFINKNNSSFT